MVYLYPFLFFFISSYYITLCLYRVMIDHPLSIKNYIVSDIICVPTFIVQFMNVLL